MTMGNTICSGTKGTAMKASLSLGTPNSTNFKPVIPSAAAKAIYTNNKQVYFLNYASIPDRGAQILVHGRDTRYFAVGTKKFEVGPDNIQDIYNNQIVYDVNKVILIQNKICY